MTQAVTIQNYQDVDRESCRSLWRELAEWHREIYADSAIGGEHPEDYFDKHLSKVGTSRIWVAVSSSKVVGFVGLEVDGKEANLEPLIVSKAYRGKGIGKKLAMKAISEAQKIGAKYLKVRPVARNSQAMGFFHKMGFENVRYVQLFIDFTGKKWKQGVELYGCKFEC